MNRTLTLSLATAAGIGLGALGVSTLDQASAFGRHGGDRGGHDGGMARICTVDRSAKLDDVLAFADSFLKLTDEQRVAWDGLASSLGGANGRIDAACAELAGAAGMSAPSKLARVETLLSTGLDIVREVRPAFDGFYATLDEEQKQAIDRLTERRGRG